MGEQVRKEFTPVEKGRAVDILKDINNRVGLAVGNINAVSDKLDTVMGKLDAIGRNTVALRKEQMAQANNTGAVSKLRLPSYIPDLTNRQIYKLVESGWSTELISKISGLGEQEIQKKYRQYICK